MTSEKKMNQKNKILVIGDLMIDEYINCEVSRISPEAPVPVAKILNKKYSLGGAANVASSLAMFEENDVRFLSISAKERNGNLFEMFEQENISKFYDLPFFQNDIIKTRILSHGHHIVRLDTECLELIDPDVNIYLQHLNGIFNWQPDLIVISDYDKGTIDFIQNDVSDTIQGLNCPVIADLKPKNFRDSKIIFGKTLHSILPNRKEFLESVPGMEYENIILFWQEFELCENIIITKSEDGVEIINDSGRQSFPSHVVEVNDVTGCGDTVTAVYAHLIAQKEKPEQAIQIANRCAGITASKIGVHKITREELEACSADL